MVGPPVMQPKAGAVKAPELSPRGRDTASLTYCSCLCVYDRWAQQVVGPPVMQPKAGAVKASELSPRGRGHCSNQISWSCTS